MILLDASYQGHHFYEVCVFLYLIIKGTFFESRCELCDHSVVARIDWSEFLGA